MQENQTEPTAPTAPVNDSKVENPEAVLRKNQELLENNVKLSRKLKEFEAEKRAREEEEAKKRGDYELLLRERDERLAKLQAERDEDLRLQREAKKLSKVLQGLGGNIDRKWIEVIDTSDVIVNPETGDVDEMSVTKKVELLRKQWPEMFRNVNAPKLPSDAPRANVDNKIAYSEYRKLKTAKEKAQWNMTQIIWDQ